MPLQPDNINFLHNNKFQLNFAILPGITYFGTGVTLPGLTLPTADFPNPHANIRIHGDTLQFDDWLVTFNVDEELSSWFQIFDWMNGLGKPQNFQQFKSRKGKENLPKGVILPTTENAALYSDATLLIQTSAKNPKIECHFVNISPTALGGVELTSQDNDTNVISATANFVYDYYTIDIN